MLYLVLIAISSCLDQELVKPSSYTETKLAIEKLSGLVDKAEKKPAYSTAVAPGTERGDTIFFPNQNARSLWLEMAKKELAKGKVLIADMELWLDDRRSLEIEASDNLKEISSSKSALPLSLRSNLPTIESRSLISTSRFGGVTTTTIKKMSPEQAIRLQRYQDALAKKAAIDEFLRYHRRKENKEEKGEKDEENIKVNKDDKAKVRKK
jgi:hypothetical protein